MEDITIQDLFDWANDHNYLNYKLRIQYRDEGGTYFGCDKVVLLSINEKDKIIKL